MASEDKTALPCAHAFHTMCIQRWAEVKGVPLQDACPLHPAIAPLVVVDGTEAERESTEQAANADQEDGHLATAMAEAERASTELF